MRFHAYEQVQGQPPRHVGTLATATAAAEWLKDRSQQITDPDLYRDNPVVKSYFAAEKIKAGERVEWQVGTMRPITLIVEPDATQTAPAPPTDLLQTPQW